VKFAVRPDAGVPGFETSMTARASAAHATTQDLPAASTAVMPDGKDRPTFWIASE
jgi:hypothetical protein